MHSARWLILLSVLTVAGCSAPVEEEGIPPVPESGDSAPTAPKPTPPSSAPISPAPAPAEKSSPNEPPSYRVGARDIISVLVYKQPELSGDYEIDRTGRVAFPLIGPTELAGLSTSDAAKKLEGLLGENFLVNPQVNLTVKEYRSKPINLLGAVAKPGTYYLKGPTKVMDLLTEAGGPTENRGDAVIVTRRVTEGGRDFPKTITLNLSELLAGRNSQLDIYLTEGDSVNLPEASFFYMSGEVAQTGRYRLDTGMTLLKAISVAGGLGKFASKRGVEIQRKSVSPIEVLKFDLGDIEGQDEPDPAILPDDVIIVKRRFF